MMRGTHWASLQPHFSRVGGFELHLCLFVCVGGELHGVPVLSEFSQFNLSLVKKTNSKNEIKSSRGVILHMWFETSKIRGHNPDWLIVDTMTQLFRFLKAVGEQEYPRWIK